MKKKKVLIITYYWPPSGGAGVQRWLKFTKYLPSSGWEPVIYTPKNPENPVEDYSLLKDIPEDITILKRKIWEPYSWYKSFTGQKKDQKIKAGFLSEKKKPKLREKLSVWIRGNLFIPDARKFWIKPSVRFLTNYLRNNPVDVIISTGPPHSMHLIALQLKKKLKVPWVADFRDPWTTIDFYKNLLLSKHADKKHHNLEEKVIKSADKVIVINKLMKQEFSTCTKNIAFIPNGYDPDDIPEGKTEPDQEFTIVHVGSMAPSRNPEILWKSLGELSNKDELFKKNLKIKLIGKTDYTVEESILKHGLKENLLKIDYVPHNEAIDMQKRAQILLLPLNNTPGAKGIQTGKLFEYLASKRPILAIGPTDGEAASILNQTQSGKISGFNDSECLKANILRYYNMYISGKLEVQQTNIESYSRKNLTIKLSDLLNELIRQ